MIKLSAVIIAFNEEDNIVDCIKSVQAIADEVVVIDSDSSDRTEELAISLGAVVKQKPFSSYVEQKNFANEQATHNYILSIDADERLSVELTKSILEIKTEWNCSGYSMNRKNYYEKQWIRYGGWYPDAKIRLFKKGTANWVGKILHERLEMNAGEKACHLSGDLLHFTYVSKSDHISRARKYAKMAAQANKDKGYAPLIMKVLFSPAFRFLKTYFIQLGFLDGRKGLLIATISFKEVASKYVQAIKLKLKE